jgi:diguanylate cyclase (GGDEF)-like protein
MEMLSDSEPYRGLAWCACGALLLALLSIADYATGPEVTVSLFYFLIVALLAWKTGDIRVTLGAAVSSSLVWWGAEAFTLGAPGGYVLILNGVTRLVTLIGVGWTICRLKTALEAEKSLARTDFVTGVSNSRAFQNDAKVEIERALRYAHPLAVCYLDLDGFKSINDSLGHSRGNDVLRAVADVLKTQLRSSDLVCRIGGDEFVILLPEAGYERARLAVNKLQTAVRRAMQTNAWPVTVSIGVAVFEKPWPDVDALIKKADEMMYQAKVSGKDRVRIFSDQRVIDLYRATG